MVEPTIKMGYQNHPATRMWRGYLNALKEYFNILLAEWLSRGYNNTMCVYTIDGEIKYPKWMDDEKIFSNHRANLLRKLPEYYGRFGWNESPVEGYIWPI